MVLVGSPADFGKLIDEDTEKWGQGGRGRQSKGSSESDSFTRPAKAGPPGSRRQGGRLPRYCRETLDRILSKPVRYGGRPSVRGARKGVTGATRGVILRPHRGWRA